jgi:hypothetical protein
MAIRLLTNGLSITLDQKKIKKNCKLIGIDIPHYETKISLRNNISIVTMSSGINNCIQYEVKDCFNSNELNNMNNRFVPKEMKDYILKAHSITKHLTLQDLL